MQYITDRKEIQAIDRYSIEEIGIPSMVLMERAAMSVVSVIQDYSEAMFDRYDRPVKVLIVTESGNNGGDGLAVARMLQDYDVTIWQIGGVRHESEQYAAQKHILKQLDIPVMIGEAPEIETELHKRSYDIIIDAIFGVGLTREVESPQKEVIELMNASGGFKVAIDIPSGIDSTSGAVLGTAFRADVTITFGTSKLGHLFGEGADYSGEVLIQDIGFPAQAFLANKPQAYLYEAGDLARLPYRKPNGNKGTFGKVAVIAGSVQICGAAILSALSAYRTGCGLVKIITHRNNREAVQKKLPEALLQTYETEEQAAEYAQDAAAWADILVIGPGIGLDMIAETLLRTVLQADKPLVIDADAITILSKNEELRSICETRRSDSGGLGIIMTPHMKEMERISGIPIRQLKAQPIASARQMAEKGYICVCKDARTVVAAPEESECYVNLSGNDGMAVGGSGDVLTGVIAALYAQGLSLAEAARMGVYIHGLAGDAAAEKIGHYSMLAGDIIDGLVVVLSCDAI